MVRKAKFKPIVTKIELNAEQAVLWCDCVTTGLRGGPGMLGYTVCTSHGPQAKFMTFSFSYSTSGATS